MFNVSALNIMEVFISLGPFPCHWSTIRRFLHAFGLNRSCVQVKVFRFMISSCQESPGVEDIRGVHDNDDHRCVKNIYRSFSQNRVICLCGNLLKYTCVRIILPLHPSASSATRYTALHVMVTNFRPFLKAETSV